MVPIQRSTRSTRLVEANEVIRHVSSFGRRFFYSARFDRVARFEITAGGRIRFVDDFTDKRVDPFREFRWNNFSHGGTLRRLVEALAGYIDSGERIYPGHFGPWPLLSYGDLWGYGEDEMEKLRSALSGHPCIRPSNVRDAA